MKIVNPCATLLTNSEVFFILNDVKTNQNQESKTQKSFQSHNTIVYETLKYLSNASSFIQPRKKCIACMKALSKFKLTSAELKQIVNMRPEHPVEVQLVVEECEERLTEEQVNEMISIINENLPIPNEVKSTASNGMHCLAIIEDTIRIPFYQLKKDFTSTLIEKIDKQYSNFVIHDVGLCVSFYDFVKIDDSFLLPGEPFTCTPVTFRYIVFQPLVNEVFMGNVLRSNRDGIVISVEFCSDIIVQPDKLPTVSKFDENEQCWYWEYTSDEKVAKLYMEPGQRVRCRVLTVQYTNIEPGLTSDAVSAITVKASMAETGLGCISWWESTEQAGENEDEMVDVTEKKT